MPVKGNGPKGLPGLESRLKKIAGSRSFKLKLMKNLGDETLQRVERCFAHQCDPYGAAWKPVRFTGRRIGGQILRDTGRLMNGFRRAASSMRFTVTNSAVYAAVHNYGGTIERKGGVTAHSVHSGKFIGKSRKATRLAENMERGQRATSIAFHGAYVIHIPARPFLPNKRGLPESWRQEFSDIASLILKTELQKGAA